MLLPSRFGRLKVVITGMLCASIFGLIKSFSISYLMYISVSDIIEFIST